MDGGLATSLSIDTVNYLLYAAVVPAASMIASVLNTFVSSNPQSVAGKVVKGLIKFASFAVGKASVDDTKQ